MKSYGPLYAGTLQYWHKKLFPIFEVGTTQETEGRWRFGKCVVARVPFTTTGYYLGVWYHTPDLIDEDDEDSLLSKALSGRTAWKPEDGAYDDFF